MSCACLAMHEGSFFESFNQVCVEEAVVVHCLTCNQIGHATPIGPRFTTRLNKSVGFFRACGLESELGAGWYHASTRQK